MGQPSASVRSCCGMGAGMLGQGSHRELRQRGTRTLRLYSTWQILVYFRGYSSSSWVAFDFLPSRYSSTWDNCVLTSSVIYSRSNREKAQLATCQAVYHTKCVLLSRQTPCILHYNTTYHQIRVLLLFLGLHELLEDIGGRLLIQALASEYFHCLGLSSNGHQQFPWSCRLRILILDPRKSEATIGQIPLIFANMEVGNDLLRWLWTEFQWPPWASVSCIALSMCLAMLHVIDKLSSRVEKVETAAKMATSDAFKSCQRQYLVVYFLVMFADWLQGTHMYSLYESYDVNVSVLFLTGFLSSAIFGNVVGPIVDRYGRRNACVVFCVLEIIINVLENIPNMTVLLLGRVLGGISTSLLFSAFESWLVTEHRAKGFHDDLLAKTFAIASEGNGLLAVLAGIVAQVAADYMGEIGPFRLAVLVTVLALVCVLSWSENYGDRQESDKTPSADDPKGTATKWSFSVYALGLCYSLFEGAMYVFVFLWYPTLYAVVPDSNLPSGLVFSSFMLCISIGGKFYDMLSQRLKEEHLASALCAVSGLMFVVPTVSNRFEWVFASFLVFEFCVGAFSPCCATLRSRYFPNDRLSTILSTFRFPTNVLVVLGTGGVNYVSRELLFQFSSVIMITATVCGYVLLRQQRPTGSEGKTD